VGRNELVTVAEQDLVCEAEPVCADGPGAGRRRTYDRICRLYDILDLPFEHGRYRFIRPQVFEEVGDARRILDCGVGTGRNIAFYPPGADVVGVDLCPGMLAQACRRARRLCRRVGLVEADVCDLPFADNSFDAAVATFLFCVLPDDVQVAALKEIMRVLGPGGRLVLLEYVYSRSFRRRLVQKILSPWVEWAYGARFDRRTREHVRDAGLRITGDRFVHSDMIVMLTVGGSGE
jgi:ubiquinone/menaquinone biosynthesis C-methylase UbiE